MLNTNQFPFGKQNFRLRISKYNTKLEIIYYFKSYGDNSTLSSLHQKTNQMFYFEEKAVRDFTDM